MKINVLYFDLNVAEDKMAAILQLYDNLKYIFLNENNCVLVEMSLIEICG